MNIPSNIIEYYDKFCHAKRDLFSSGNLSRIDQIIVIPAFAENNFLLKTLLSIAENAADELAQTLILCVINNCSCPLSSIVDIENNQETIGNLNYLIWHGASEKLAANPWHYNLSLSRLRLAYIDASSASKEMPDMGGVGAARKMGMDAALKLFDYDSDKVKLILSLDADTLVSPNYLKTVRDFFDRKEYSAALVNYSHQLPGMNMECLAIKAYEIFMRYYVLGLRYAGSPYAFHTIGSTIVCTADAYAAVGGMNNRRAAEDFYFLNKLVKYTNIGHIDTTVHPSARISSRVPFGTGHKMSRFKESMDDAFLLYDPRVFVILKKWLKGITQASTLGQGEIISIAQKAETLLPAFLEGHGFFKAWDGIQKNIKTQEGLLRHFHSWFDAFKTMKFVRYITSNKFPMINMFDALEEFIRLSGNRHIYL